MLIEIFSFLDRWKEGTISIFCCHIRQVPLHPLFQYTDSYKISPGPKDLFLYSFMEGFLYTQGFVGFLKKKKKKVHSPYIFILPTYQPHLYSDYPPQIK